MIFWVKTEFGISLFSERLSIVLRVDKENSKCKQPFCRYASILKCSILRCCTFPKCSWYNIVVWLSSNHKAAFVVLEQNYVCPRDHAAIEQRLQENVCDRPIYNNQDAFGIYW